MKDEFGIVGDACERVGIESSSACLHPHLSSLIARARARVADVATLGIAYPCDSLAISAAVAIADARIARPILIGPCEQVMRLLIECDVAADRFEIVPTSDDPRAAAQRAAELAKNGTVQVLMKGSLHTDELMAPIVAREAGLRTSRRMSLISLFDLPCYPKLLSLADCGINIAPTLEVKRDILSNAVELLQRIGISEPKVAIVTAVETVNPAIQATLDADALVQLARANAWPGATVEGPLGFDNAISLLAAKAKGLESEVAGDADLLLMPDLNSANILYKSLRYMAAGDCASVVIGARVPIVLTSRADSLNARLASAAVAVLTRHH